MKEKQYFTKLPDEIMADERITLVESILWSRLNRMSNGGKNIVAPSKKYLAGYLKCSTETVKRSIKSLIKTGYISVLQEKGKRYTFTVLYPWKTQNTDEQKKSELDVDLEPTTKTYTSNTWDDYEQILVEICEDNKKMFGNPDDEATGQAIGNMSESCEAYGQSPSSQIGWMQGKFKENGPKWLFIQLVLSVLCFDKGNPKMEIGISKSVADKAYDRLGVNASVGIRECIEIVKEEAGYCGNDAVSAIKKISKRIPEEDTTKPNYSVSPARKKLQDDAICELGLLKEESHENRSRVLNLMKRIKSGESGAEDAIRLRDILNAKGDVA